MNRYTVLLAAVAASLAAWAFWPTQSQTALVEVVSEDDAGFHHELIAVSGSVPDASFAPEYPRIIAGPWMVERFDAGVGVWSWPSSDAPWQCACSTGNGCEILRYSIDGPDYWADAAKGEVMQPQRWRGNCVRMPCMDTLELRPVYGIGYPLAQECR